MSDLRRHVISTAQQIFLEGVFSYSWDMCHLKRRHVLIVTTHLMRVTAHLFPKVCDTLASPDYYHWFKVLKRPLISVVDPLLRSWPLIAKRCQSDGQGEFAHLIIKVKILAPFLLLYAFFPSKIRESLSPKTFQTPFASLLQNPSYFLPPPILRGF